MDRLSPPPALLFSRASAPRRWPVRGLAFGLVLAAHVGLLLGIRPFAAPPVAPRLSPPVLMVALAPPALPEPPRPKVTPPRPPTPLATPTPPAPRPKPRAETKARPAPPTPAPPTPALEAPAHPAPPVDSAPSATAAALAPVAVPPPPEPAAISCRVPPYPPEARRRGQTGTVDLALLVDEAGDVVDRRIERTSGVESLDLAALDALSKCRFRPGTVDGRPQKAWARLRYVWTLK